MQKDTPATPPASSNTGHFLTAPAQPNEPFELATTSGSLMLAGGKAFDHIQRVAKLFSGSSLVPKEFQGNVANCTIALEMAHRMGASPMAVMQNLYIVHGKPGWSAQFIIAAVNQCGKFSPLRFDIGDSPDGLRCVAWATEKDTGERLQSPPVTIAMAKAEGWMGKNGSKWQTMPELMLRYRAATFFGRMYAPELLMGMRSDDELRDVDTPSREALDVPAATVPTTSPTASGPRELGGSSGSSDAVPSGVKRRGQPETPLVLSADPPPIREELSAQMQAAGVTWEQVAEQAINGGLHLTIDSETDAAVPLEGQADDDLAQVLAAFANIVADLKGGSRP